MKGTVKGKGARGKGEPSADAAGDVDTLYQLPLADFTAARNALAARVKKAGGDADAVKALTKPSISAWAVNQLFWRHRHEFDRLMTAGERFRDAQAAQLAGKSADLRAPLDARREALSDLSRLAAGLLHEAGNPASPDMMRRVTTTLEALAVYGRHEGAPPAGRLHDDVDPPGFEALSALVPRIGTGKADGPSRVLTFRQEPPKPKKKLDPEAAAREAAPERKAAAVAARAAIQEAERALRDARREMQTAEAALKKVAARTKQAEAEKAAAEARLEQAAAAAEEARQDARRVAADAETAAQTVEDAERALQRAQHTLRDNGE